MYTYKTVIFDLDGTLFKTDTIFVNALNEICTARGVIPWPEEKLREIIGEPSTQICRQVFGDCLTHEESEQLRQEIRALERSLLTQTGRLYEGVGELLTKLQEAGYTLCICSNGSRQYIDTVLQTFNLTEKFSLIKSGTEGLEKSQLIKQILEESTSRSAIIVGDRWIDFTAADDAGCLSIGVTYGYGRNECGQADFTADTPPEVYQIIHRINSLYKQISLAVVNKKSRGKPLLVGINGVDTSGKTVFTKELDNYLTKWGYKVQRIHLDDFHNPSHIRLKEADPVMTYWNNAFDLEKLEKELLQPISTHISLDRELMLLDLHRDEFTVKKRYQVDQDTIVLIEGVLLYREPIDPYFDMRIFLDITFEEVLRRAYRRDGAILGKSVIEKYQQKYIPIQKRYIEKYSPKDRSDIIINNEDFSNPEIIHLTGNPSRPDQPGRIKPKPGDMTCVNALREMYIDGESREMPEIAELPDETQIVREASDKIIFD